MNSCVNETIKYFKTIIHKSKLHLKLSVDALTSVARLVCHPVNQKVVGLTLVRAHAEAAGSVPGRAHTKGNQFMFPWHISVCLPLSKSNKHVLRKGLKKEK